MANSWMVKSATFARRALAVSCVALALLGRGVAGLGAQPSGETAGRKLDAIRQLMEAGQGLYISGNYGGAAEVFENGFKAYPYSAFLFNAGICYQKLGQNEQALGRFNEYLKVDPEAPDQAKVKARIAALTAAIPAAASAAVPAGAPGVEGESGAAEPATPPPSAPPADAPDDASAMRSLVVVETEPSDAPLHLYARTDERAPEFKLGAQNQGWKEIASARAPASLTLAVGKYHVVVDKFRDFNESHADIDVSPGHVYQFKANLSQGEFMAFLRVSANVKGAYVWLDDRRKERPFWGATPHGELVAAGPHEILVEVPGFEPLVAPVTVEHGEQKVVEVELSRVGYGFLRVDSNAPEIKVRIDEQPHGVWRLGTDPLEARSPAGLHKLTVIAEGRKTFEGMVDVPRGQVLPVHVKMIPKYPRGAAWTQAVIGAAFIGAAAYFGNESNKIHDELQDDRAAGRLEADDSRVSKGRWYAVGADAGFAVGGVLGVLATYNFIKDPLPDSSLRVDKPLEFDDPLRQRPLATRGFGARARTPRIIGPNPSPRGPSVEPLPIRVGAGKPSAPGLYLEGSF